ncbi:hypothetical protein COU61_01345 [Candidatus Pacearchaeota archaeon CG10_big_fil_rev_8_21_14_0_10_35_13]|nr:MAG: hypothetical protein COU61_01345 [Candidatus Pacearchaeota archaeon CG10_big_fil_rev_8_21_14_0_10_35_13]
MNKRVIMILLVALAVMLIVINANAQVTPEAPINNTKPLQEIVKNVSKALDFNNKLTSDIKIPESMQLPLRVVLGVKADTEISFSVFVILLATWLIFYLIILKAVKLISILHGWKSYIITLIVMLLISSAGGMVAVTNYLYTAISLIKFFDSFSGGEVIKTAALIIILVIIYLLLRPLIGYLKKRSELEKAYDEGFEESTNKGILGRIARTFGYKK